MNRCRAAHLMMGHCVSRPRTGLSALSPGSTEALMITAHGRARLHSSRRHQTSTGTPPAQRRAVPLMLRLLLLRLPLRLQLWQPPLFVLQ